MIAKFQLSFDSCGDAPPSGWRAVGKPGFREPYTSHNRD